MSSKSNTAKKKIYLDVQKRDSDGKFLFLVQDNSQESHWEELERKYEKLFKVVDFYRREGDGKIMLQVIWKHPKGKENIENFKFEKAFGSLAIQDCAEWIFRANLNVIKCIVEVWTNTSLSFTWYNCVNFGLRKRACQQAWPHIRINSWRQLQALNICVASFTFLRGQSPSRINIGFFLCV